MGSTQTPGKLGEKNKKIIVDLIKREGPMSRADIARRISMSFPAVSSNVQYLLDHHYIYESGQGQNDMGRKSMLLTFNAKKGYVMGIDLGRSSSSLLIADLLGESVYHISKVVDIHRRSSNIIEHLDKLINNSLKKSNIDLQEILSIGIGIPGVLDKKTGKMILVPFVEEWNKFDLLQELKKRYSCPITIENSVNMGALGEKWKGCGQPHKHIVYFNYSIGIGSSLILNNDLYVGNDGAAGEVGYSVPGYAFVRSGYKEAGVMEELICGQALDDKVKAMGIEPRSLKELFEFKGDRYEEIKQAILQEIYEKFFILLVSVSAMINPSAIILSGKIGMNIGKLLVGKWAAALKDHVPFPPELIVSEIGSYANVCGALRYAMQHIADDLSAG
jgi:predicted NBD/HSP70 family sugar kinase